MRIAEIFRSVQGEGLLTGTQSVFVRASGCNLRCWYCDTPYASWKPEGDDQSVDDVVRQILQHEPRHVVLTGGEPMLFAELIPLCDRLRQLQYHITIETAGTLFLPLECDLMSISPKLSNSTPWHGVTDKWRQRHEQTRFAPDVIRRLSEHRDYQFKFVIDKPEDLKEVDQYLAEFPAVDRNRVWLMPQGIEAAGLADISAWLEPYCRQAQLQFCPRMQVQWYGLMRGT